MIQNMKMIAFSTIASYTRIISKLLELGIWHGPQLEKTTTQNTATLKQIVNQRTQMRSVKVPDNVNQRQPLVEPLLVQHRWTNLLKKIVGSLSVRKELAAVLHSLENVGVAHRRNTRGTRQLETLMRTLIRVLKEIILDTIIAGDTTKKME
jgi:hypothetical protein